VNNVIRGMRCVIPAIWLVFAHMVQGQDASNIINVHKSPVGDYLREDYIKQLRMRHSAVHADIGDAPTLLEVDKRDKNLHVQTIINFHEGDVSLEWDGDKKVRVLDDGSQVGNVRLFADRSDSLMLEYGQHGLARYVFVGNAEQYVGRELLVGRYVSSDGKPYEFGQDGVAVFPDHTFKYVAGVDHVINHFDYLTDTESGKIFAFKRTGADIELYNTSGPLSQVMDRSPLLKLKRIK